MGVSDAALSALIESESVDGTVIDENEGVETPRCSANSPMRLSEDESNF